MDYSSQLPGCGSRLTDYRSRITDYGSRVMVIIPAIDLKDGRCVRLRQGDLDQETQYSQDPPAMAAHWEAQGASCLHVVDLNGAVEGRPKNIDHVLAIASTLSIPIQVGGGIRTIETIRTYLSQGVRKVVLGTAVLDNVTLLAQACEEFPERIIVGVDVKHGKVAVRGWTNLSDVTSTQIFQTLRPYPISAVIFTEISRDGMLEGPNLSALAQAVEDCPFPIIASGGVARLEDVRAVKQLGEKVTGIIIGKALYEGTLELSVAIRVAGCNGSESPSC